MTFPAEQVPGGDVWFVHHFVYASWAALFVCWLVTEDDQKPWGVVGGLLVALFSWYHIWPSYSVTGAGGVLAGLAGASLAVVLRRPWRTEYAPNLRAACLLCLLIAWDDTIEHAFGVWMPLDWVWNAYLWSVIP